MKIRSIKRIKEEILNTETVIAEAKAKMDFEEYYTQTGWKNALEWVIDQSPGWIEEEDLEV